MPTFATIKPSDFVKALTEPGIDIGGTGSVPLKQYLCAVASFGGNKNSTELLGPLQTMKDATGTALVKKTRNYGRMMTGQGYPEDFELVMKFIADNLDAVRKMPSGKKYFPSPTADAVEVLNRMVEGKVFGLDCIGFISQYLVAAEVWDAYKTYYPKDYFREFEPISRLKDIARLCILVWSDHIAIVDRVSLFTPDIRNPTEARVDICQSSSGGPQINRDAILRLAGKGTIGGTPVQLFKIYHPGSPKMPVTNDVSIAQGIKGRGSLSYMGDWLGTE